MSNHTRRKRQRDHHHHRRKEIYIIKGGEEEGAAIKRYHRERAAMGEERRVRQHPVAAVFIPPSSTSKIKENKMKYKQPFGLSHGEVNKCQVANRRTRPDKCSRNDWQFDIAGAAHTIYTQIFCKKNRKKDERGGGERQKGKNHRKRMMQRLRWCNYSPCCLLSLT